MDKQPLRNSKLKKCLQFGDRVDSDERFCSDHGPGIFSPLQIYKAARFHVFKRHLRKN